MVKKRKTNKVQSPLKMTVETVTPEIADKWIKTHQKNRNIKEAHVDVLGQEMLAGRWMVNGSAIKFDENGELLNGYHRLHACIKYEVNFDTCVVRGVPRESKPTDDIGSKYSLTDNLYERDEKNVAMLAATLTRLVRFNHFDPEKPSSFTATRYITSYEALEYLDQNPDLREAVSEACRLKGLPRHHGLRGFTS